MNSTILWETMNWHIGVQTQLSIKLGHHIKQVSSITNKTMPPWIATHKAYSEFEDEFLDEKGDEWLPLGKSFQNHIKLYIG